MLATCLSQSALNGASQRVPSAAGAGHTEPARDAARDARQSVPRAGSLTVGADEER